LKPPDNITLKFFQFFLYMQTIATDDSLGNFFERHPGVTFLQLDRRVEDLNKNMDLFPNLQEMGRCGHDITLSMLKPTKNGELFEENHPSCIKIHYGCVFLLRLCRDYFCTCGFAAQSKDRKICILIHLYCFFSDKIVEKCKIHKLQCTLSTSNIGTFSEFRKLRRINFSENKDREDAS
jgi:hypothetical protein